MILRVKYLNLKINQIWGSIILLLLEFFLVHNFGGKWIHWGKAHIIEQTIHAETKTTSSKFKIVKIYDPEYMKLKTLDDVDGTKDLMNFLNLKISSKIQQC